MFHRTERESDCVFLPIRLGYELWVLHYVVISIRRVGVGGMRGEVVVALGCVVVGAPGCVVVGAPGCVVVGAPGCVVVGVPRFAVFPTPRCGLVARLPSYASPSQRDDPLNRKPFPA